MSGTAFFVTFFLLFRNDHAGTVIPGGFSVEKFETFCKKGKIFISAGLRVLLSAHKVMSAKGGMKLRNVNEIVQEVFEVTGFADILDIES